MVQMSTNRRLPAPTNQGPSALATNVKFLPSFVLRNFIRKRPSPYTGYRQSDPTEAAATTRTYGNNRNRPGARPQSPHKHSQPIGSRRNTQKGPRGEGRPPPGRKTSLAKRVGGKRGRRMEKSRPDRKEKRRREPERKARRGWECPREKAVTRRGGVEVGADHGTWRGAKG